MLNDRPLQDPRTQEALQLLLATYRYYDLAGGCYVVNPTEMGFGYALYTTWNAIIEDEELPMGLRIRAKTEELGAERAKALLEGTAWTIGAMRDFGRQSEQWGKDLMRLLRQSGLQLTYTPFDGKPLPHIGGIDMRRR